MGLRYQLLYHHIQHGSGGEAEEPWHQRSDTSSYQHYQNTENRLHAAGEGPQQKSPAPGAALLPQRKGDGGPLREVLDADAQGQGRRPAAAGSQPGTPKSADCSMAGSSRLQTLAAVITPAAKPSIVRWNWGRGSSTKKNTTAAPKVVIRKVKPVPKAAQLNACSIRINAFSSIQAEFCLYASIGDPPRMCADGEACLFPGAVV